MTENKNAPELSDMETELYDRQIRLWGLESQKRLRGARILLCGLNGLGAEVAKNVILSGIKSITFLDHRLLQASDLISNFLAPRESIGQHRCEASVARAQALNPMVEIHADRGNIGEKPDAFFAEFDVVVAIECDNETLIRVNNSCRAKDVKFFAGDVWGMFGWSFSDLGEHSFAEDIVKHKIISKDSKRVKTEKVVSTVKRTVQFAPFEFVVNFDVYDAGLRKRMKRNGPAFVLLRILQTFRAVEQRDPHFSTASADVEILAKLGKELLKEDRDDDQKLLAESNFQHLFAQISPVAAIVGGVLSQEIIKAVSQKEAPHRNVFLFEPSTCCGYVEEICPVPVTAKIEE